MATPKKKKAALAKAKIDHEKEGAAKGSLAENEIKVFPAKRFFVESLTRDIDLADAILDVLDNCVDGARRVGLKTGKKPYEGYCAEVKYTADTFTIEDNCGGISLDDAKNNAFCFGRPAEYAAKADGTIGIIGIGMKRAIFKLGRSCVVRSQHKDDTFQVKIDPEWLKSEKWPLYFDRVDRDEKKSNGTRITVTQLNDGVTEEFKSTLFRKKLWEKVTGAFALLIARGFQVKINGDSVESEIPTLLWQDRSEKKVSAIQPYVFRDTIDGVSVYIAVGFRAPDKQTSDPDPRNYYSTEPAGWTVACNDRVVLFCDKSEQTGWGTGRVPEYHTQFIRISGFAEFSSMDPTKLPFTTTKHGVNQQSKVFLKIFDKLREGTKMFTDWTYQFKDYATQKEAAFDSSRTQSLDVEAIKHKVSANQNKGAAALAFTYKPKLPEPNTGRKERTISFRRSETDVRNVSMYLFGNEDESASHVGEQCFDYVLKKAKK